jgi:hypothetical protein
VEPVSPRLGDRIHDGAAEAAVFRVKAVRFQAKLRHRIDVWNDRRSHVAALGDVASIHQEGVCRLTCPIDGNVSGIKSPRYRTILRDGTCARRCDARLQSQQIDVAAAVERQRQHLFLLHYVS